MDKRRIIYGTLIAISILSILSALIPGFFFPFFFLFFPFMFGGRSFSRQQPQDTGYIRPEFCHVCGFKLKMNWKFCPSCSQPIELSKIDDEPSYYSQYR